MSELLDWQMELSVELSLLIDHLSFRFTSRFFYHPPAPGWPSQHWLNGHHAECCTSGGTNYL